MVMNFSIKKNKKIEFENENKQVLTQSKLSLFAKKHKIYMKLWTKENNKDDSKKEKRNITQTKSKKEKKNFIYIKSNGML